MMIAPFWHTASVDGEFPPVLQLSKSLSGVSLCPGRHMASSTVCGSKLV